MIFNHKSDSTILFATPKLLREDLHGFIIGWTNFSEKIILSSKISRCPQNVRSVPPPGELTMTRRTRPPPRGGHEDSERTQWDFFIKKSSLKKIREDFERTCPPPGGDRSDKIRTSRDFWAPKKIDFFDFSRLWFLITYPIVPSCLRPQISIGSSGKWI